MEEMFEKATVLKLRFQTPSGILTVEDLWDVPLTAQRPGGVNLDDIARSLHREIKQGDDESFVLEKTEPNVQLQLRFELVKHIIRVKLAQRKAAELASMARERKHQILEIIAAKQIEDLKGKPLEELTALVESL